MPADLDNVETSHPSGGARESFVTPSVVRRRCLQRLVDKIIVPDEDDRNVIFQAARHQGRDIFFRHLKIRSDGGLGKQRLIEALYSRKRIFSVVMTCVFVLFNLYTIVANWYVILTMSEHTAVEPFMLLIDSKSNKAGEYFKWMQLAVASTEVATVLGMLLYSLYIALRFNCCASEDELKQYRIWHQLYNVSCEIFPRMSNFSAMKSLQFLNPQVLGTALSLELTKVEEGRSYCRVLVCFVISRLLLGALGFVAFSMKFAHIVVLLQDQLHREFGVQVVQGQVVLLFGFVNQAFGITQISQVETSRLFLFIFGGEDSAMQAGELDRQEAYLACIAYTILTSLFPDLPPMRRRIRRAAALLSFTHLDIQSLVLDEDESCEVDAQMLRKQATSTVKEQSRRSIGVHETASYATAVSFEMSFRRAEP